MSDANGPAEPRLAASLLPPQRASPSSLTSTGLKETLQRLWIKFTSQALSYFLPNGI